MIIFMSFYIISSVDYLQNASKSVYNAMVAGDPQAIWLVYLLCVLKKILSLIRGFRATVVSAQLQRLSKCM